MAFKYLKGLIKRRERDFSYKQTVTGQGRMVSHSQRAGLGGILRINSPL